MIHRARFVARGGGSVVPLRVAGSVSPAQKKGIPKPGGPRPHAETTPFRQKPPLSLNPDSRAHIRRGGDARRRNVTTALPEPALGLASGRSCL